MKAFNKLAILLVLSVSLLPSCSETSSSSVVEEINYAQQAIDTSICLNDGNGSQILPTAHPLVYADSILLAKTVFITAIATTVNITWRADNDANWILAEATDPLWTKATPVRPSSTLTDDVETTWTATANVNMKTAEVVYNFTLVRMTELEEYGLPLTVMSDARLATAGTKLRTQGYVTAVYGDGNGFYIQEGEAGAFVYYGSGVAVGNYVSVTGVTAWYNGLFEIVRKSAQDPLIIKIIANPTSPVPTPIVITEANWSSAALLNRDCNLVSIEGLTYFSGTMNPGSHSTIIFKLGATSVSCYSNYHTMTANQQTIKDMLLGLVAGDTLNYEGIITWYNGPQLGPISASNFTVVHAG